MPNLDEKIKKKYFYFYLLKKYIMIICHIKIYVFK